ncbi:MAG: hypothetical protein PWQ60_2286 [Thermoanaerobacteraceae bacterium]|jgi:hypothetical protein|nr:hypothetical protein [Thermoanaerobacteraceae bacterium]
MFKKIGFLVALALVLTSVSVIAAPIVPLYVPVEVDLEPEHQYVTFPNTEDQYFDGEWAGGQTDVYYVVMDYDDGDDYRYYTSGKNGHYTHHYDIDFIPLGYKWHPELTVSNGNTDSDSVIVEFY